MPPTPDASISESGDFNVLEMNIKKEERPRQPFLDNNPGQGSQEATFARRDIHTRTSIFGVQGVFIFNQASASILPIVFGCLDPPNHSQLSPSAPANLLHARAGNLSRVSRFLSVVREEAR